MATAVLSPILQDALPRDEAAAYIGVEVCTMAGWRILANIAIFCLVPGLASAFYKKRDLDRWIEKQFSSSSGQV